MFSGYKKHRILIICFLSSILLVSALQILSVGNNDKKNDFIRLFPPHVLEISKTLNLNKNGFYIAGMINNDIYIWNSFNPKTLMVINRNLSKGKCSSLDFPENTYANSTQLHLTVDSPYLFINNYATGIILKGNLPDSFIRLKILDSTNISSSIFLPTSNRSFAVRIYDRGFKRNILGKLNIDPPSKTFYPDLIEAQIDGVFSSDGMLRYDASSSSLVYIYFYRNQFICLNDSFKVRFKGRTIDTNTYAKIKVSTIISDNKSTISSPGYYVNRQSCINNKWILINSDLKADNEQ